MNRDEAIRKYLDWRTDGRYVIYNVFVVTKGTRTQVLLCILNIEKNPFLRNETKEMRFAKWVYDLDRIVAILHNYFNCHGGISLNVTSDRNEFERMKDVIRWHTFATRG